MSARGKPVRKFPGSSLSVSAFGNANRARSLLLLLSPSFAFSRSPRSLFATTNRGGAKVIRGRTTEAFGLSEKYASCTEEGTTMAEGSSKSHQKIPWQNSGSKPQSLGPKNYCPFLKAILTLIGGLFLRTVCAYNVSLIFVSHLTADNCVYFHCSPLSCLDLHNHRQWPPSPPC